MLTATGPMETAHEVEELAKEGRFADVAEPRERLEAAVNAVLSDVRAFMKL